MVTSHFGTIMVILALFLVADTRFYTLPCRSVGRSVGRSVHHIFEIWMVFALLLLPNLHDWIAVYPALFLLNFTFYDSMCARVPRLLRYWP